MTMTGEGVLSESLEDYLEAILRIIQDKQAARAKDIGRRLNVAQSSVTGALQALARRELINYAPYDVITLTEKGRMIASDVARRHEVLKRFFVKVLDVDDVSADTAACRMEHVIGEETLRRFVLFVDFMEKRPDELAELIEGFGENIQKSIGAKKTARVSARPAGGK